MFFLNINPQNYEKLVGKVNKAVSNKKNKIFILYYLEGCGPCNATRPEWKKIENTNIQGKNDNNIYVVEIDQTLSSKLNGLPEPTSFPTIKYITDGGKTIENYEDSSLPATKDRSIDSFVEWIQSKNVKKGGKKHKSRKTRKSRKSRKRTRIGR
jgi:hypothetical protein